MQDLNTRIDKLPALKQDSIKAELDHLASLANPNGMLSAEQICAAQGVDLEGLEGVQDVLLMLAINYPQTLERVATQSSLIQRTGGRNWSAFQFEDDGKPWMLAGMAARTSFEKDAISILQLPDHRRHEADWFTTIRTNPITGEETEIVQATIYVEDRAESELTFGQSQVLERQVFQKVLEVGIAINSAERILEVCAKGGKKIRDQYASAFAKHFLPNTEPPIEAPRRAVLLEKFRTPPRFSIEPADGIDRVEVTALEFWSSSGGFARFERRSNDENIYQFLQRQFRDLSPLRAIGWMIIGATLRIVVTPQVRQRSKTLTITLRSPNTTTIPNKTEKDRQFAMDLLERWELIAAPPENAAVIEDS